jgi:hypothetical protein
MTRSFKEIFDSYNSDKNSKFHNYCRQYEPLLTPWREKPVRLLEIGVFDGESVKIWREIFPNAKCIVGVDIDPYCAHFTEQEKDIYIEIADATKKETIEMLNAKYGPFDIIVDDGSHVNVDVFSTFEHEFPLLVDGGLYIVEDTICFKSNQHISPINTMNHLSYFVKFIPGLNQWRVSDSTEGTRDHCVDPFKILKKTSDPFEQGIDKIEFGCSYIAIHKKVRTHWIP